MGQLVDQAYEAFSDEARRRSIDYRQEARDRPVIVSDGDRVLQIVGNLLSNAFRATPDGGQITLKLMQTNGTVSVTVGDSGPRDLAEKQERLFRPVAPRVVAERASAWRSPRNCRRRWVGGSPSTPKSGAARGSSSCCRGY